MSEREARILLVEDNELDVEKIVRGLKRLGMANDIRRAKDGYDALEHLRGENGKEKMLPPYLILLDMNMPRMNGPEFLQALRSDESISHAPVIILTTSDRREDVETAYRHNVAGYIVKPVKIEQMYNTLETFKMFWSLCELPRGQANH